MPWLYLVAALAALVIAFQTTSVGVLVLCLVVALVAALAWMLGLLAQRVGSRSRDDAVLIDPAELRRLRERAEARRLAAAESTAGAGVGLER